MTDKVDKLTRDVEDVTRIRNGETESFNFLVSVESAIVTNDIDSENLHTRYDELSSQLTALKLSPDVVQQRIPKTVASNFINPDVQTEPVGTAAAASVAVNPQYCSAGHQFFHFQSTLLPSCTLSPMPLSMPQAP